MPDDAMPTTIQDCDSAGSDASASYQSTHIDAPAPGIDAEPAPAWRQLPAQVKRVWLIVELIASAALIGGAAAFAALCVALDWWGLWQGVAAGAAAAVGLVDLVTTPLQIRYSYQFCRFRIGERDIRIAKGWIFRSSVTVPFNRVQHVDTKQGPVLRSCGLTKVVVSTAVGTHEIEALESDEAERVVEQITVRVLAAKEDV